MALTGSAVTGGDVSNMTGSMFSPCPEGLSRAFFLTIVVQNVPLRMTDMATGSYRRSRDPGGGSLERGVRMRNNCAISVLLGPFHRK